MEKSVKTLAVLPLFAAVLAAAATPVLAQENPMQRAARMQAVQSGQAVYGYGMPGYGPGYGMGMMGGYGPGAMMGQHGSAYGMGPGMGMMGPGVGMMGPGMGMMGPMAMLNLSDAQLAQVEKIQAEMMGKQRTLMRQMWDEQEKLNDLNAAEKRDPDAIGKAFGRLSDLQRQALEARVDAENRMVSVLTKEQKAQLRRGYGRGMMGY